MTCTTTQAAQALTLLIPPHDWFQRLAVWSSLWAGTSRSSSQVCSSASVMVTLSVGCTISRSSSSASSVPSLVRLWSSVVVLVVNSDKDMTSPSYNVATAWLGEALTFGLCRFGSPKIKHPPVQHVLPESTGVRLLFFKIWDAFGEPQHGKIFPWSPGLLAQKFVTLLSAVHGDVISFHVGGPTLLRTCTIGGLRAGAAAPDFISTQSTSRTRWRGRWASDGVLKHYLQLGMYYGTAVRFSAPSQTQIQINQERLTVSMKTLSA